MRSRSTFRRPSERSAPPAQSEMEPDPPHSSCDARNASNSASGLASAPSSVTARSPSPISRNNHARDSRYARIVSASAYRRSSSQDDVLSDNTRETVFPETNPPAGQPSSAPLGCLGASANPPDTSRRRYFTARVSSAAAPWMASPAFSRTLPTLTISSSASFQSFCSMLSRTAGRVFTP